MNGGTSKLRTLSSKDLLVQLPMLQHLLQRLVDCKPSGQATHDPVVQVGLLAFFLGFLGPYGLRLNMLDQLSMLGWSRLCTTLSSRWGLFGIAVASSSWCGLGQVMCCQSSWAWSGWHARFWQPVAVKAPSLRTCRSCKTAYPAEHVGGAGHPAAGADG